MPQVADVGRASSTTPAELSVDLVNAKLASILPAISGGCWYERSQMRLCYAAVGMSHALVKVAL